VRPYKIIEIQKSIGGQSLKFGGRQSSNDNNQKMHFLMYNAADDARRRYQRPSSSKADRSVTQSFAFDPSLSLARLF
jgi:hypothetical protein